MDKQIIKKITEKISRRFPEVSRVKPQVKKIDPPKGNQREAAKNYLLFYKTTVSGPGGNMIPRIVRVVATPDGKILKTTTSR